MIVQHEDERTLMDCEALAAWLNRPVATVRRHCQVVAEDERTGRKLFDADEARKTLSNVARREPHKRPTRRS